MTGSHLPPFVFAQCFNTSAITTHDNHSPPYFKEAVVRDVAGITAAISTLFFSDVHMNFNDNGNNRPQRNSKLSLPFKLTTS